MKGKLLVTILFALVLGFGWSSAWASDGRVHITPLGSNGGNSCGNDRAIILEDPNGTRILYDPGRTVAGGADPRLGQIDGMILSSVHSDHIGVGGLGVTLNGVSECNGTAVDAEVNSNFIAILAFKQNEQQLAGPVSGGPIVRVGGEIRDFLKAKLADEATLTGFQTFPGDIDTLRHGGSANIGGVKVAVIAAHHSNGIPLGLVDPLLFAVLNPDDLVPYVGPENGYVLYFTNTLAVYLSGDTGHTSDMKHIVRDFYGAKVAILNCGDKFSMGPRECAFAVNKLIKPRTAIPSHIRETATTSGVVTGAKTQEFIDEVRRRTDVIVPLSGVEISCNSRGRCTQGPSGF